MDQLEPRTITIAADGTGSSGATASGLEPSPPQAELEVRLRFETLIADLSSEFINLPAVELDAKIQDAQRRVCQALGLDVSSLWQWSSGPPGSLTLTHLYRREELPPASDPMEAEEYFPWCLQQLCEGKVVTVSSMAELPAEAARDRRTWSDFGIKTTLTIPLSTGRGPLLGALSFNDTQYERTWPEELAKRLQLVAQVFANAIARKRSDLTLWESEQRLSLATAAAGLGVWVWDVSAERFWATAAGRLMLGLPQEGVLHYQTVLDRIHPDDRETVDCCVRRALDGGCDFSTEHRILLPEGGQRWIAARGRHHPATGSVRARMFGVSVDITDRKEGEAAREERLRFEKLLADLSAGFVNAATERLNDLIDESLAVLVEFLGNDRSTLLEFGDDTGQPAVTHSCAAAGWEPFPLGLFSEQRLPWFIGQLRIGRPVFLPRLPEDLPAEAENERSYCIAEGIRSNVAIPLK
ncbi:MAG: GAF domain-containing protein, partial [Thermoguttaceae bacterium]